MTDVPAGQVVPKGQLFSGTERQIGLNQRLGVEILEAGPERIVGRMPVEGNTQPYGLLHGGASCVLAESLGSTGAALHAGEGRYAVGVDINATHHRGASEGWITGGRDAAVPGAVDRDLRDRAHPRRRQAGLHRSTDLRSQGRLEQRSRMSRKPADASAAPGGGVGASAGRRRPDG